MSNTTALAAPDRPYYVIAAIDAQPYVRIVDEASGRRRFDGFMIDIINEISGLVGFDYRIRATPDGRYGHKLPDGTWTGMVGDILRGGADVATGPLQITLEREEAVDFSKPVLTSSSRLLVKKPEMQWEGLGILAKPFTHELWFFILLAIIIVSVLFYLISRLSPYSWLKKLPEKDRRFAVDTFNLKNSFLFVFSTITWQGYREAPRCFSGRVLAAFWWIFTFFMIIAYTANLTAFLLVRRNVVADMPYKDYNDLIRQNKVSVGVVRNSFEEGALERMSSISNFELWDYVKRRNTFVDTLEDGVLQVKISDGRYALLVDSTDGDFITGNNCDLGIFGDKLNSINLAFACRKGSGICNSLDKGLLSLRETGRVKVIYNKWFRSGVCAKDDTGNVITGTDPAPFNVYSLSYRELSIALILLFLGALLAFVILIGEIVFVRLRDKKASDKATNQQAEDDVEKQELKETEGSPPQDDAEPQEEETKLVTSDEQTTEAAAATPETPAEAQ
ncbi:hypothetical protein SNE40_014482 [Patella caerulea]|uniref:Uncharacterized protein n=1 Tax=Patella caerulea TaxID=87958 RepID=A0AAN8PJ64_PATCE